MRAFEFRNGLGVPVVPLGTHVGTFHLGREQDAVWPPKARAYGGPADERREKWGTAARAVARLIVPVLLLLVLLGAGYLYADAILPLDLLPVPIRGGLVTVSDLILPGAWYAIHLTNRRYGPGHAFGQLLAALGLSLLVILINPGNIDNWVTNMPSLTLRAVLAFGAAFLTANFAAIIAFDAARGPRWWTAPLAASWTASLIFSAIYYPAAFSGLLEDWRMNALLHAALFGGLSVLLLVPYCLLRPAMRPINGMNGY